jgi:hypothetical protein
LREPSKANEGKVMIAEASSGSHAPRVLDVIDYFAQTTGVREDDVKKLLAVPKFQAAALAFVNGQIPLGYAVLFCLNQAAAAIPDISAQRLADFIRQVARRIQLDQTDHRYIYVDVKQLFQLFPQLYFNVNDPTDRKRFYDKLQREMEGFEDASPWKKHYNFTSDFDEHKKYISYWVDHSEDKVRQLFLDPNFVKHFPAYLNFELEYAKFLKAVYGDGGHILFPELGWFLSSTALGEIAQRVKRGALRQRA